MTLEKGPLLIDVQLPTGESVHLPIELWQILQQASAAAADAEQDPEAAFMGTFAKAMIDAGLLLVKPSDPKSTQSVTVQTYSLALQGKHAAEAKIEAIHKIVMGWEAAASRQTLMNEMVQGMLALCGQAPPADRVRLRGGFMRLRALAAILKGSPTAGWDLAAAEPPPASVSELLGESQP